MGFLSSSGSPSYSKEFLSLLLEKPGDPCFVQNCPFQQASESPGSEARQIWVPSALPSTNCACLDQLQFLGHSLAPFKTEDHAMNRRSCYPPSSYPRNKENSCELSSDWTDIFSEVRSVGMPWHPSTHWLTAGCSIYCFLLGHYLACHALTLWLFLVAHSCFQHSSEVCGQGHVYCAHTPGHLLCGACHCQFYL